MHIQGTVQQPQQPDSGGEWVIPEANLIVAITGIRWRLLCALLNPFAKSVTFHLFPTPDDATEQ